MVTLYFRFLTLHSKYAKWSLRPRRLLRNLFANERHKKTSMAFQTDTMKLKHCEVLHIWSPMSVVTHNSENSPSFWVFLDLFLDFIIRIFSFKMKRKKTGQKTVFLSLKGWLSLMNSLPITSVAWRRKRRSQLTLDYIMGHCWLLWTTVMVSHNEILCRVSQTFYTVSKSAA